MNNKNFTKVICSNCGAEIVIPEHQTKVSGVAIGKDSKLGTVVLPTAGNADNQRGLHDAITHVAVSIGVTPSNKNATPLEIVADLIAKIQEEGYVDVNKIVRRWVPSQCIDLLNDYRGFHKAVQDRGIDYSWSVLLNDLKRQMELYAAKDNEGYNDRKRWYNKGIAVAMANDYLEKLRTEVSKLPARNHRGRKYVRLVCNLNGGRGVHIDELTDFYDTIVKAICKIRKATTPKTLFDAVDGFNDLRRSIKTYITVAPAFLNAYKAAGAYYTMKDFILFEGCKMKVDENGSTNYRVERYNAPAKRRFVEQQESLAALELKAEEIVNRGVIDYGYELLGLLKDFLSYNNFDYTQTKDKWARQSEARRLMRVINGSRRPRN